MRLACCTGWGESIPPALANGDALIAKMTIAWASKPRPTLITAAQVGGYFNLPAAIVSVAAVTAACSSIGTTESARVNAILVLIKVAALTAFIVITMPVFHSRQLASLHPQ